MFQIPPCCWNPIIHRALAMPGMPWPSMATVLRSSVLSAVSTAADVVLVTSSTPEPWKKAGVVRNRGETARILDDKSDQFLEKHKENHKKTWWQTQCPPLKW